MSRILDLGDRSRPVRCWLWLVAALIIVTLLVGGATRLTGSGLSITEWRPISGILPPLGEDEWLAEFDRYRAIPQFVVANSAMTLAEFKVIYWWEWVHRLLARLIGLVFVVPFLLFLWRGALSRALAWKLGAIFALGGVQGAVGWWMVQSGLSERTDVSQYRLAMHLTLACVILAAVAATAVSLKPRGGEAVTARARITAGAILALVFMQIFLGALVAKTGAGKSFNTWPLIDGWFLPPTDSLLAMSPLWKNFFENVLTVQFNHRMIAYALLGVAALHSFDLQRTGPFPPALRAVVLFTLVTAQGMLGVLTLVHESPAALALAHQAGAIAVLAAAAVHVPMLSPPAERA
jgi:cytochrome c oxidase assembly protein subunit 15